MGAPFLLAPPWASSIAASARSTPFGLLPSPLRRTLVSATSSSPCPCPVQQQGGYHHQGSPTLHSYSANWLLQHQLLTITSRITHLTWGHVTGGCMQHAVISSPFRAPSGSPTHGSSAVTTTQRYWQGATQGPLGKHQDAAAHPPYTQAIHSNSPWHFSGSNGRQSTVVH